MNTNSFSNSYKEAGVDVTAGYKAVELMKQHVARTMTSGVLSGIGGFGGQKKKEKRKEKKRKVGFRHRRRWHKAQDSFSYGQA